jgi:hypothetical protein
MKQSSTRKNSDDLATHSARAPAQAFMDDQRQSTADLSRQAAAMQNSPGVVAQQKRADSMAHAQGAGALQLQAAGNGVAQLGPLDWIKDKLGMGKDAARRVSAKKQKFTQDVQDKAMGAVKGGMSGGGAYARIGAPTEQDIYNDMLDEEAAGRERMQQRPAAELGRMAVNGLVGGGISAGKDALNAVAPLAGTVVGKVAGMGKDKLNNMAKEKIGEGLNPYKVLRDDDEDDESDGGGGGGFDDFEPDFEGQFGGSD